MIYLSNIIYYLPLRGRVFIYLKYTFMEMIFKASKAHSTTKTALYNKESSRILQDIETQIKEAAKNGRAKLFTDIPQTRLHLIRTAIEKAGYLTCTKGNVTMNNTYAILLKIEW